MKTFDEIFIDKTKYGVKVQTSEYNKQGKYIIIDQGQSQIAGYTDREEGAFEELPVIVFGDHTRTIKYVDTPFFLGADGVKLLRSKDSNANYKYLYYALRSAKIPDTGYNRHFKWLKNIQINYPDNNKQKEIVQILDRVSDVIKNRKEELYTIDKLVKARFVEMFGEPGSQSRYSTVTLGSISNMISGGTPSSKHPEYFGGNIPFVSTPCLGPNFIDASAAQNWLTELGVQMSSAHIVPVNSLMVGNRVGVGKSSINICEMCTNQDILSFVDIDTDKYDLLFVKKVIEQYGPIFESQKRGATIKGVPSDLVKASQIPQAPIDVQRAFAAFVRQVDKSKSAIQKSLEKTQLLFDSLMQEYFG